MTGVGNWKIPSFSMRAGEPSNGSRRALTEGRSFMLARRRVLGVGKASLLLEVNGAPPPPEFNGGPLPLEVNGEVHRMLLAVNGEVHRTSLLQLINGLGLRLLRLINGFRLLRGVTGGSLLRLEVNGGSLCSAFTDVQVAIMRWQDEYKMRWIEYGQQRQETAQIM